MARGDHIRVYRRLYWHHGIDAGDGTVIHLSGEPGQSAQARVQRVCLESFLRGGTGRTVTHRRQLPADEVMARAGSRLGETGYHLLFKNCEHFARWCMGRSMVSRQVESVAWQSAAAGMALRGVAGAVARRAAPILVRRAAIGLGPVASTLVLTGTVVGLLSQLQARGRVQP